MTTEYYWHAKLPSGDWAVLWYKPDINAHQVVAVSQSEVRAEHYAAMENDLLRGSKLHLKPDTATYQTPREKTLPLDDQARIGLREGSDAVLSDLPKLFEEFPQGFNTDIIRERYGYTYNSALEILRFLHATGSGRFIHKSGKGGAKIFVAPDSPITETELTASQEAALKVLKHSADRYGLSSPRLIDIAARGELPTGSVPAVLMALEKKGLIMLAKPGGHHGPATYQISDSAL